MLDRFPALLIGSAIVGVVLNILLLIWVFNDYEKRGGTGGGACVWCGMIFVFGLLGLLCYLVARPTIRQPPVVHVNPMMGGGGMAPPQPQYAPPPQQQVPAQQVFVNAAPTGGAWASPAPCPNCGAPIEADSRFCAQCGMNMAQAGAAASGRQPGQHSAAPMQAPPVAMPLSQGGRSYRIGRDGHNEIAIPEPQVSGTHAQLTLQDGQVFIEDLGSTNGTWVNGQRLVARTRIHPGDRIGLGSLTLRYEELMNRAPRG